jgi:hypothetical protein
MNKRTKILCLALVFCLSIASATKAGVSIIGSLTHQKKAKLGETYEGSIILINKDVQPQEVKIYQTDYLCYFNGTNDYGAPGKLKRSNATWLSFSPQRIIIPSKSTATVNYTVKVPNDPNLVGTYWSMLMVEEIPKSSPESSQAEQVQSQVAITQIIRYGIQMITDIGDTGEQNLKFVETKLLRENEKRLLRVDIENTGQKWLRPYLWVELYDESGKHIGRFETDRNRIYPGASVRYKIDLSDVPQGSYQALVVADCGGDCIFGANYTLKFE